MAALAARNEPLAQINITPLVDVMLVLLVIFMIAAPALTGTLSMALPQPGPVPPPAPKMTLHVEAGDVISLDGRAMARSEATAAIAAALAASPRLQVALDVDPGADYGSAMHAMALARNAGVEAIALVEH
jgi:biopolymer transport protein ExbD